MIHSKNLNNLPYYLSFYKPDIVILEAAERVVNEKTEQFGYESIITPFYCNTCSANSYEEKPLYIDNSATVNTSQAYTTIFGSIPDEDTYALAADFEDQRYYAHLDFSDNTYTFTIRNDDFKYAKDIKYWNIKNRINAKTN